MHWRRGNSLRDHVLRDGDERLVSRSFQSDAFAYLGEQRNGVNFGLACSKGEGFGVVCSSLREEFWMVDVRWWSPDSVG